MHRYLVKTATTYLYVLTVIFCLFFLNYTKLLSFSDTDTDTNNDSNSLLLSGLSDDFDIPTDAELTGDEKEFITENDAPSTPEDSFDPFSIKSGFILFNIGSQGFRERLAISGGVQVKAMRYPLRLNYGKWDMEIQDESTYFYDLKAKNIGTSLGASYYPIKIVPVFINLSLGYSFWKGDITPHITDSVEFRENFNSTFDLQALNFSLSMGWSYFFKNGIFLEHCIYGIGAGLILKSSFSNSLSSKITSASKQKIKHLYGWGVINFGVGKIF